MKQQKLFSRKNSRTKEKRIKETMPFICTKQVTIAVAFSVSSVNGRDNLSAWTDAAPVISLQTKKKKENKKLR